MNERGTSETWIVWHFSYLRSLCENSISSIDYHWVSAAAQLKLYVCIMQIASSSAYQAFKSLKMWNKFPHRMIEHSRVYIKAYMPKFIRIYFSIYMCACVFKWMNTKYPLEDFSDCTGYDHIFEIIFQLVIFSAKAAASVYY